MKDLNAFELINVAGGDSNCLCQNSNNELYKTKEIDGPSCAISCCQRRSCTQHDLEKYDYQRCTTSFSWTWFGKEYSTQGHC